MEEPPKGINEWEKASDEERWKMLNPEDNKPVVKNDEKAPENKTDEERYYQIDSESESRVPVAESSPKPAQEEEERFPVVDKDGKRTGATITASEAKKKQDEFIEKWTPKEPAEPGTHEKGWELGELAKKEMEAKTFTLIRESGKDEKGRIVEIDGKKKFVPLEEEASPIPIQENQLKPQTAKERTIVSPEEIENFVPIEDRVRSLKENMVAGAHNQDTEDFLKMISEPYERVGKMKEDKSGKTFLEKAKEVASRGKEWLTRPWLKERLKGFATGGLWELWQGAKFQVSARMTGKELVKANEKMEADKSRFTYDDAVAVHNKLLESGNLSPVDRAKFEQVANSLRREKNMQYIDLVTAQARAKMKERLNWGSTKLTKGLEYRDRDGNKVQFDDVKLDQMMLNLRAKLIAMQDGAVKEDIKGFTGIIKKDLDPKYWKHYQYAAVDALLWTKGYLALNKYFAVNAISGSSEAISPPVSGTEQIIAPPTGMDRTVWQTVEGIFQNPPSELGLESIPHPNIEDYVDIQSYNDAVARYMNQLTEATKYVVKGNGIGVDIWNIKGAPLDTMTQQGHPLDMNPLYKHWQEIIKLGTK
ncbi:MAG: hypothetical protein Q8P07_00795 [bacterium]|nr:hypothetical protein [bacterium]